MNYKKIGILKSFLGTPLRSSRELLFFCPKCKHHKKKLSVNLEKDKFKCWICDYKGNSVTRLVRRWANQQQQSQWPDLHNIAEKAELLELLNGTKESNPNQKIELPKEFISLVTDTGSLVSKRARNYLVSRGITFEDISKYKLGYCNTGKWKDRIIFPSFNTDGDVNYFTGRTYSNDYRKYMLPEADRNIVFNELMVDWDRDVILTEGVFDSVNAENSIPILGSTLRKDSQLFAKIIEKSPEIYMALDPDAEKKSQKIIDLFLKYGIMVYKIDLSPYEDLGCMPKDEFIKRKKEAVRYSDSTNILMSKLGML